MTENDFDLIRSYTPDQVVATGADLSRVQPSTLRKLDLFCFMTRRRWALLHNGLTSGRHASPLHPLGLAVDVYPESMDGLDVRRAAEWALVVGFGGRGVYWNGKWLSMHLDQRYEPGSWARWRHIDDQNWHEMALICDPREVERAQ